MKRFYRFINGPNVPGPVSDRSETGLISSPAFFPEFEIQLDIHKIYDFGVDFLILLLLCRRTFRAYFAIPTPPKMARLSSSGI